MYLFYRAVCCFPARARAVLLRLLWCVPRLLAPLAFSLPRSSSFASVPRLPTDPWGRSTLPSSPSEPVPYGLAARFFVGRCPLPPLAPVARVRHRGGHLHACSPWTEHWLGFGILLSGGVSEYPSLVVLSTFFLSRAKFPNMLFDSLSPTS